MPGIINLFGYKVYFWSNEGKPLEPVHVHVDKEVRKNATKIWILEDGSVLLEHNNSRIPEVVLGRILKTLPKYHDKVISKWEDFFKADAIFYDSCRQQKIEEREM